MEFSVVACLKNGQRALSVLRLTHNQCMKTLEVPAKLRVRSPDAPTQCAPRRAAHLMDLCQWWGVSFGQLTQQRWMRVRAAQDHAENNLRRD